MKQYRVRLGRSVIISETAYPEIDFWGSPKGYNPLPNEDRYTLIAISAVNESGEIDYLMIGQQPNAEEIVKAVKDDEMFMIEAHFSVEYKGKKLMEFDGTLYDALLVAANEGAQYDV